MSDKIVKFEEHIPYEEFYERILKGNIPCILSQKFTVGWPCITNWVNDGRPDLSGVFQSSKNINSLPVANCGEIEFGSHPKLEMTPAEYTDYWEKHQRQEDKRLLYLKDWHFCWTYAPDAVYRCHEYFSSDWMNEFWDYRRDLNDDFRFVYVGPAGTWTPFHADVYRSFSWSTNVCGRKRWIFFAPGEEKKLKLKGANQLPFDVREEDLSGINHIDFMQEAGETVFVPSGWFHQVMNEEDTISLNHNWINACAITPAWKFLHTELRAVEESIRDVEGTPGWKEQTQVLLRAFAGINYLEFYVMVKFIFVKRLTKYLVGDTDLGDSPSSLRDISCKLDALLAALDMENINSAVRNDWLCLFDLQTSLSLLFDMESDEDMKFVMKQNDISCSITSFEVLKWYMRRIND